VVAELLGLVISIIFVVLVLLPLLTFLRLGRMSRELEDLAARVAQLEAARAAHPASAADAATAGQPAAPIAPVAAVAPVAPASPADAATAGKPVAPIAPVAFVAPAVPGAVTPDLEERIGGRGLLYTGVLVLLFGVSFFLKYAFDNAWIDETGRSVLGALGGIGLVWAGLRLADRGLAGFGQALVGTGFAILYLVVYASLNFYGLIDRGAAFAAMVVITVAAAVLADRQRSQPLAFIAVGGGLLTPALVGGEENAQLTLFTYDAVLVIGTMLLSLRHQWLALNALSYIGTILTIFAWSVQFYTDDQWLRTLLFLTLFCVSFLIILRATRQSPGLIAWLVRGLLYTAPLLYHIVAVVITAGHPPAVHVYLIAFTVVGLWLTVEPHRPKLRLAILLGAFAPLFGTLTLPDGSSWLVPNVVTIVAVVVLHVMALIDRAVRQEQPLHGADLVALHLSGLGLFALLYEALQPAFPEFRGGLALVVGAGTAALARWLRPRDKTAALNALALTFAIAAIGIAVEFDGAVEIIGWAVEGVAVAWVGVAVGRYAFQVGGLLLWVLAAVRLFESFGVTPAAFTPLVNAPTFATLVVVASGYAMAWRLAAAELADTVRARLVLHVLCSVLTLGWLTAEIQSYWEVRYDSPQAYLYEQMLLSLAWGVYGALAIAAGMLRRYAPLRYIGITVISLTSLKVFFYDLWELGGIYRVIGFIAFGVLLVLVSYLYQKKRGPAGAGQSPPPPPSPPPPSQPPPSAAQSEPLSANITVPSEEV
jgi:uncharacterized membrane protein